MPGNAISPGVIDSGTWDHMPSVSKQQFLSTADEATLVGRHGESEDIVSAVRWLLGSGFDTGGTLHVEGGRRFRLSE